VFHISLWSWFFSTNYNIIKWHYIPCSTLSVHLTDQMCSPSEYRSVKSYFCLDQKSNILEIGAGTFSPVLLWIICLMQTVNREKMTGHKSGMWFWLLSSLDLTSLITSSLGKFFFSRDAIWEEPLVDGTCCLAKSKMIKVILKESYFWI